MTQTLEKWVHRLGRGGLLVRAALLLLAFALLWAGVAPVAWMLHGTSGVQASAAAILICLIAGWLALTVTSLMAPPQNPVTHVGVGMALRMGLPLIVFLMVSQKPGGWNEAGFAWYLIIGFLVGLLLETVMAVGQLKSVSS